MISKKNLEIKIKELIEKSKSIDCRKVFEDYHHFHNYSMLNYFLIKLQKRDASQVAGFKTWNRLGRRVKKGEKGIWIQVPFIIKKKKEALEENQIEQEQEKETVEETIRGFGIGYVFDVSQTEGEALPAQPYRKTNDVTEQEAIDYLKKIEKEFKIERVNLEYKVGGYINFENKKIFLNALLKNTSNFFTAIHEAAHFFLEHNQRSLKREDKKIEAELTTFFVSQKLNIHINSEYYLATWTPQDWYPKLENLTRIDQVSKKILKILQN